ncbi:MAG: hypothetical protein WKG07_46275 [Hymenobacter sp.]
MLECNVDVARVGHAGQPAVRTLSSSTIAGDDDVAVNSTQKRSSESDDSSPMRDDSRSMRSMFSPPPDRIPEICAMCPAVMAGPSSVMMKRLRVYADTHASHAPSAGGRGERDLDVEPVRLEQQIGEQRRRAQCFRELDQNAETRGRRG